MEATMSKRRPSQLSDTSARKLVPFPTTWRQSQRGSPFAPYQPRTLVTKIRILCCTHPRAAKAVEGLVDRFLLAPPQPSWSEAQEEPFR
jgi:hypothetical protein